MKQVIVTGSRYWADFETIAAALRDECPDVVIHGGAKGADEIAGLWAALRGVSVKVYYADWRRHGPRAGPLRNGLMLRSHPGAVVLAFPLDGPGTRNCILQAKDLGMTVKVFAGC